MLRIFAIILFALTLFYPAIIAQQPDVKRQTLIGVNYENVIHVMDKFSNRYGLKLSHELINRLSVTTQFNLGEYSHQHKNPFPDYYGPGDYIFFAGSFRGLGLGFDYRLAPFSKGEWNNRSTASMYLKGGVTHQWQTSKRGIRPTFHENRWVYYAGVGAAFYVYKNIGISTEVVFQERLISPPWLNLGVNYRFHCK